MLKTRTDLVEEWKERIRELIRRDTAAKRPFKAQPEECTVEPVVCLNTPRPIKRYAAKKERLSCNSENVYEVRKDDQGNPMETKTLAESTPLLRVPCSGVEAHSPYPKLNRKNAMSINNK